MSSNGKTATQDVDSGLFTTIHDAHVAYVIADLNRAVRRLEQALLNYRKLKEETTDD